MIPGISSFFSSKTSESQESTKTESYKIKASPLMKSVAIVGLGALALCAIENAPGADAGPCAYYACVAACEALITVASGGPGAAFVQACILSCAPAWAMPTP